MLSMHASNEMTRIDLVISGVLIYSLGGGSVIKLEQELMQCVSEQESDVHWVIG